MTGDIAWIDGAFVPRAELALPIGDAGFVLGATVTEQLRTFRGRLFLADEHAQRLTESLALVGIEPTVPVAEIMRAAAEVAAHNHALGDAGSDLGVVAFVTPGDLPAQHEGRPGTPRAVVHSFPLAFSTWAKAYDAGIVLRTVSVAQVPEACWPIRAKVRSRLHYFLADREAAAVEPGARAVLAHADGRISETSTANVAIVRAGGIVTPPAADALAGISLGFARRLAAELGIRWDEASLTAADLAAADEILLTSTPSCILPATRYDGRAVGGGRPGPVYRDVLAAWSAAVGIDIRGQAANARPHPA
jgi:branched-subunit amino acid aminotransferase/4-amino-4-deoxychorismate lyase